jgi:hypothetical protein
MIISMPDAQKVENLFFIRVGQMGAQEARTIFFQTFWILTRHFAILHGRTIGRRVSYAA